MMHLFAYFRLCVLAKSLLLSNRFEIMKKLYLSKTFLKWDGRVGILLHLPWIRPCCLLAKLRLLVLLSFLQRFYVLSS